MNPIRPPMSTAVTTQTSSTSATYAPTASPSLQQMKTELAAALVQAGVKDAKATDTTPKGFPAGVGWADAYRMVAKRVDDSSPATPGNLVLSADLLKANLSATKTLAALGVTSLSRFPKGSSVSGAIDALYRDTTNGKLASTLAKSGIYDLSAFPGGTSLFQAFKLIEDPGNPGQVSLDAYKNYKAATVALKAMDITTLANFPRGSTILDAQATLAPKADLMLSMVGVDKRYFKDPNVDSLTAVSLLSRLPDTIRSMNALPTGMTSQDLARQAVAAKKLVAMGYDSLAPFASMASAKGVVPKPSDAYTLVKQSPPPADLPAPVSASTEVLFQPTIGTVRRSYGQPNPVTSSVYVPPASAKVTPNPPATNASVVTAAQVLAFNRTFWGTKAG